jgi:hypothetical protein
MDEITKKINFSLEIPKNKDYETNLMGEEYEYEL